MKQILTQKMLKVSLILLLLLGTFHAFSQCDNVFQFDFQQATTTATIDVKLLSGTFQPTSVNFGASYGGIKTISAIGSTVSGTTGFALDWLCNNTSGASNPIIITQANGCKFTYNTGVWSGVPIPLLTSEIKMPSSSTATDGYMKFTIPNGAYYGVDNNASSVNSWCTSFPTPLNNSGAPLVINRTSLGSAQYEIYFSGASGSASTWFGAKFDATQLPAAIVPVTVGTPSSVTGTVGTTVTGNPPTGVAGGTSPYTYSDGTADALCTAPVSPTMALPAGKITGLVASTGAHSVNTTGLAVGTYQYCIKVCDATGSNCAISKHTIVVTAPPCNAGTTAPSVSGTSLSNTCPTATADLNSLHNGTTPSGASLVWFTNNAHTGTAYATPTTAAAGTYYAFYYDATNNCYSPATSGVTVIINAAPSAPTVTVTQPTCAVATGTITVTAPSSGVTYSFDNGVTYQPSNIKSGLAAGATYQVVVKDNTSGCVSTATPSVIDAAYNSGKPNLGTDKTIACGQTVTLTDLSSFGGAGATYQWYSLPGNGVISGATTNTIIAQPITTTSYVLKLSFGTSCSYLDTVVVTVTGSCGNMTNCAVPVCIPASAVYNVGTTNGFCGCTGLTCNSAFWDNAVPYANGYTFNYVNNWQLTLNPFQKYNVTGTISKNGCGANTLLFDNVLVGQTSCFTSGCNAPTQSYSHTFNTGILNPAIRVDFQISNCDPALYDGGISINFTTPLYVYANATTAICGDSTLLEGFYQGGDNGTTASWRSIPAGFTSTSKSIKVRPSVTTQYIFEIIDNGCTLSDTVTVIPKPNAGADQTSICSGTSVTLTGTSPTTGTWTAQTGNPTGATLGSTTAGIASVSFATTAVGIYNFIYTADGCTDTMGVSVAAPPSAPTTTVTQPTCSVATGTITVTAPTTGVTYSFNNGTTYQPSNIKSGLAAGAIYQVVVKDNISGCTSTATAAVLTAALAVPSAPTTTVTQPTCSVTTGTITVNTPSSGVTYSFDNGATYQASATSSALATGTYQVIVKDNTSLCTSTATPSVINAAPTVPSAPTTTVTQPTCSVTTGTITVTAPTTGVTYSFNNGTTYQASATSSALATGTYQVLVKDNTSLCTSTATPSVINAQPVLSTPTLSGTTLSNTCPTTTVNLNGLVTSTAPSGARLRWHTVATNPAVADSVATPSVLATAGTYYAYYFDATNSCYSPATASVTVTITACCATPTVGGTAAYTGGTLCDASNIGTAMLTGNTGNIVRWETSTNSGGTWSPIASTNTYYNFANAVNGQQFRAVVNNGSGCLDANSAAATIATSATNCTTATCDNTTGNVTFTVVTPPSNANLKSHVIMTNNSGVIQYASAKDSVKINGVAVGDYLVYRVVYDSTQLPLPNVTVGTNITAIGGACAKFTNQLAYKVCPAAVPDLVTIIGQPSPTLQVGVTSDLPITVRNIGTGPAPGIITTTITLPTGVTAPATFTSNGWTCSTSAPSVMCTNPGPIAAGRDSTFNVPVTPNASIVGTNPIFNANTNPVTGETNTGNNTATPTATTSPVAAGIPDLITTIGQPSPALQVGVQSNLPITVANTGTGPAPGVITTTITLPTGVTAPATFTSNGWTCSTTSPLVTCTNPGPIAAGRDSTFNVPITPNASLSGTTPTFNATTNPVTGETNTTNNTATPTTTTMPVVGGSLVSLKVLLQGNYDPATGWMHDSLRKKGLVPLSDPYRTAAYSSKFTHKKNGATQTTTNAVLAVTGANAIVDWVFVELHSATNPATVVATMSALVQRDGDVVSAADGVSPVLFDSITSGNYFIALRHRNHLGVMTATTRSLSAASTLVDFTTLTAAQLWNKANGDGYETTKAGIRNLLWAGDTDGNRQTVFSGPTNDVDPVFFDVMTNVGNINFVPNYIVNTQYLASDVNLDGRVIYQSADNEVDIILFMVLSHTLNTGFIPSYIIVEQLP